MKNIALVAVVMLTLFSCKQNENAPKPYPEVHKPAVAARHAVNPLCDELSQQQSEAAIKVWIENHQVELCDGTLYECVLNEHKIDFTTYYTFIRDYWQLNDPKYKTFTWLEIKHAIADKCYPDYVGFKIDSHDQITDLKIMPFTTTESCYSAPLFRAIDKLSGTLADDDQFKFTLAKVKGAKKVIFTVELKSMGTTFFFDISDNPTLVNDFYSSKLAK